jgi:serine/threonine protein kinase/formylglycine-generating enzyme required for sulfatase activity
MPSELPSGERIRDILARYVERRAAGESVAVEDLCREHASLANELRELIPLADSLLERLSASFEASLHERLEAQFGSDVDPQVSLEREPVSDPEFSSAVLSRLAGRAGASTRYRIKDEVAHGGMGAVLRVWDQDLRRHLAMKVMLTQGGEPQAREARTAQRPLARFLEEAQVTGQLDHPGIVPVHELGLDAEGRVYFTMKLVKGQTLREVFDALSKGEAGWTQTRVLGLLLKACEAMSYAHAKGVIHRDLKPANIMVGHYGEVFVMDWGLAKILGRADEKDIRVRAEPGLAGGAIRSERSDRASETPGAMLYTMDGDVLGTPAYMPPEQARGELAAMGPQADVYALGAILYHLLAGHPPYLSPDVKASHRAIWQLVQRGPPEPVSSRSPRAPAELVAICERAMAPAIGARYADMSSLAADLSAYLEGRVVRAYETGAWAEARKWIRRNKPLGVALAAAVALLVVGLISSLALKAQSDANAERADDKAKEAEDNLKLAQRNELEAKAQQRRAEDETAKVLRLSDAKVLQQLREETAGLWPARPDRIAAFSSWLERARALVAKLPLHRETLTQMRAAARELGPDELAKALESHRLASTLRDLRADLANAKGQLSRPLSDAQRDWAQIRIALLEAELAAQTEKLDALSRWRFDSNEQQWQHDLLVELVSGLAELESGELAADAIAPGFGWSVPRRVAFARELETEFAPGGEHARAWEQSLPKILADYPGLELSPQMGLVPLGPDPQSGLWEFAHLMSGEPSQRDAAGQLVLTERTGIVLVLLGRDGFWMGAQPRDPAGRHHDPQAQGDEGPVHEVELSPYFISKYELTQGQWLRLTGRNPSLYRETWRAPDGSVVTLLHPVEQVSWEDLQTWLPRAGLTLPSEAQWEFAVRAGTDTPWWTGELRESLREQHAVNLADQSAARGGAAWGGIEDWPELDDGFIVHAPVGTFAANPFGLHETTGNIWELCLDGYDPAFYAKSPRMDPVCESTGRSARVARGGGCDYSAEHTRSSARASYSPTVFNGTLGARPARAVEP